MTGIDDQTPATRARIWMRFVHTGEVYGLIGQTLAGLASLAAALSVYTGLALSYRRLILPLFRRGALWKSIALGRTTTSSTSPW